LAALIDLGGCSPPPHYPADRETCENYCQNIDLSMFLDFNLMDMK